MKLLFDENLSFRLVAALADVYPGSAHVRDVGLLGGEDPAIWAYAAKHGFLLTSKDTDFYDRSVFYGAPPQGPLAAYREQHRAETAELLRHQYILSAGSTTILRLLSFHSIGLPPTDRVAARG